MKLEGLIYYEEKVILRVLRRFGPMSANRFDQVFGDSMAITDPGSGKTMLQRKKLRVRYWGGRMLGDMFSLGYWSKWLDLTQSLFRRGFLSISKERKEIIYSV